MRIACEDYAKNNGISFGWGRIFYVYGHNENPSRLTPIVLNAMMKNQIFELGAPNNFLDYMYTKDIAHAFIEFLKSDYAGSVNICTGKGILLKDYASKIQELMGKKNLIKLNPNQLSITKCVGDNSILENKIGFKPQYSLDEGLKEVVDACCS